MTLSDHHRSRATDDSFPQAFVFQGADILLGDRKAQASLRIEGGRITGLDTARDGARVIDARGMELAPGLIDIHGDAFERQMMARPGVRFPLHAARLETDRQLAANGIATAYHALTLSWEPGLRSVETGRAVVDGHAALAPSIAFNDRTSMALLLPATALQDHPFDFDPTFPVVDLTSPTFEAKMNERTKRSGLTPPGFVDLIREIWTRRTDVPAKIAEVAAMDRAAGPPMLSHDDSQLETRDYFRSIGARLSEFPMNLPAARGARAADDWIVFGAPNAARGGSHLGSPGAADMIRAGLCDILASDYFHPAMLTAITRLLAVGVAPLPALWKLIAANPAAASKLTDRGRIEPCLRADPVLHDWPDGGLPAVRQTWVAGRPACRATAG